MNAPTVSTPPLPSGFKDLTASLRSSFWSKVDRYSDKEEHKDAYRRVFNSVVQFQDKYLTCFGDNTPITDNTKASAIDAVFLHTTGLTRSTIEDLLPKLSHVQRHAYYPGFPRFLSVGGAVTFNTWKPAQRLQIDHDQVKSWISSKKEILADLRELSSLSKKEALEAFIFDTEPYIWQILMRMLFGNQHSPVASKNWRNEQEIFTRWTACVVHKPLLRPQWAPVLRSVHGIGKGTYETVMRALMGSPAVNSVPNIEGLTDEFAGDAALTRLLVLNEVLQKTKNTKADQKLKMFISDNVVPINRKHEQRFFTQATHATILFSNYRTPFTVPNTERRFWVPEYREYDSGTNAEDGKKFHAKGNRFVREILKDDEAIHELLCWLKLVADDTPVEFLSEEPASAGIEEMWDLASTDAYDNLEAWLHELDLRSAVALVQVSEAANIPTAELTALLRKQGFRNCQMRSEGNRKVWTKAPAGKGPQNLVTYRDPDKF